jgi:L-fuculose-phosphate aldolase
VIHCHPVFATAFAAAGKDLSKIILPEVLLSLGKIPLCSYGTPSTDELTESMKPFIKNSWALLLQNHGAVTMGTSITDAYYKMEKLEHAAKTLFVAELLGGAKEIPQVKIDELLSIAEEKYGIKPNNINLT